MIIGIHAVIKYHDSDELFDCYMSFGEYDEEGECDSFGIPDGNIFYYLNRDELEKRETPEFKIIELHDYVSISSVH